MKAFIAGMICVLLAGCAPRIIEREVPIFIGTFPKDEWLVDCDYERPPARDVFQNQTDVERIGALTVTNIKQLNHTQNCNIRLGHIRQWKAEQLLLIEQYNAKEK